MTCAGCTQTSTDTDDQCLTTIFSETYTVNHMSLSAKRADEAEEALPQHSDSPSEAVGNPLCGLCSETYSTFLHVQLFRI